MGQRKILVESINCNNDEKLRSLLFSKGFRGCITWIDYQSLEVCHLPDNCDSLLLAINELGLSATFTGGE